MLARNGADTTNPILATFQQPILVDKSSIARTVLRVPPTMNARQGAISAAKWAGRRTIFDAQWDNAESATRFNTSCVVISLRFLRGDGADPHDVEWAYSTAPPWNLACHLFRELHLVLNDTPVVDRTTAFAADMHVRALRNHDWDELETLPWVFAPIAVDGTSDNYLSTGRGDDGREANTFSNDPANGERAAYARSKRWLPPTDPAAALPIGTNSSAYVHTIRIPFADLIGTLANDGDTALARDGCPRNLQRIKLELVWNDLRNVLEHANNNTIDYVHIDSVHMELDQLRRAPETQLGGISDKLALGPDRFVFSDYKAAEINSPFSHAMLTSILNLESVALVQFARGANSLSGDDEANYASLGQTGMFNLDANAPATLRVSSMTPAAPGVSVGLKSIQLATNSGIYPSTAITLAHAHCCMPQPLYCEFARSARGPSAPLFYATMPLILLKQYTDNGIHRSLAQDAQLRFVADGGYCGTMDATMLAYYPRAFRIGADGVVSELRIN